MQEIIIGIWVLQGLLMIIDEFKFHHKRGLGSWERIGHPIDTLFFLLPFIFTLFFSSNAVFVILCIFSSLLVTKDEFIHIKECDGFENLLHALLFIIHPVALYGLWLAWKNGINTIIYFQISIILVFMTYQFVYWNLYKGKPYEA